MANPTAETQAASQISDQAETYYNLQSKLDASKLALSVAQQQVSDLGVVIADLQQQTDAALAALKVSVAGAGVPAP